MKKLSFRIAVAAIMMVVGTMSLSAQIGRGGVCLNTGATGTCVYQDGTCLTQLTDEQKVILQDLFVAYQADMDELRTAMWTAPWAEKLAIRQQMIDLRTAHLAAVKALLAEWGYL